MTGGKGTSEGGGLDFPRASGPPKGSTASLYRKAVEIQPDYGPSHNDLGILVKETGQLDAAVTAIRKAVDVKPEVSRYLENLARALKDQGSIAEASRVWEKIIIVSRREIEAVSNDGRLYNSLAPAAGNSKACSAA